MDSSIKGENQKNFRDKFLNHVLNWNPNWFRDKKYRNNIPDALNDIKLTTGKLHYNNVDEYQSIMFPQIIHEYWFTLQKDYDALFEEKNYNETEIIINCDTSSLKNILTDSYKTCSFYCFVKGECVYPPQGTLVELVIKQNKCFAYVTSKYKKNESSAILITFLLSYSSAKILLHSRLKHSTMISITFIEGYLGMVDALSCLEYFPLCKMILSPNAEQYRMPSQLKLDSFDIPIKANPNPSQLKVISGIIETIEQGIPKIGLVQGPPGTGKSNTIVNVIASMLKRNNRIKFLVCAASNKAVDSLTLRLMQIQPTLNNQNIPFKIVRVGNEEKMDKAVQKISLKNLMGTQERWLQTEKKKYILNNSQVFTMTLTACFTTSLIRQVFGEQNFLERLVCVVDEAAQATEVLTMIPLLLGVKFLFLIGDHLQLEPIVLSQKAENYGYNSSLFTRAQKIFATETINPIVMLDTQYRMTKPISKWPNKYFYNSRLKDAASVNPLGICNYMLFNHNFPQNSKGHANEKEAQLVIELIMFIMKQLNLEEHKNITIGVITPYHEQRALIQRLLNLQKTKFPEKFQKSDKKNLKPKNYKTGIHTTNEMFEEYLTSFANLKLDEKLISKCENDVYKENNEAASTSTELIEVNTVDSFQGSERDIIIMSCVRSNNLGFTKNPNRLNVSITRAKHTLIMFGNFQAFRKNSMWSNLIQDATERNVLVQINTSNAEFMFNKYVSQEVSEKWIISFGMCLSETFKSLFQIDYLGTKIYQIFISIRNYIQNYFNSFQV